MKLVCWSLLLTLLALMLLPVLPLQAQSEENTVVRIVITGIEAKNLNEDTPVIDDGEDEMQFFYELLEVDPNGRVLQSESAVTAYQFSVGERASGANFDELVMIVSPENDVIFTVRAIEVDSSLSDEDAQECGAAGAFAVVQCIAFGECFGLLNPTLLLACLSEIGVIATGTDDDLFEENHLNRIDPTNLEPELVDTSITDIGRNSASYDIEYTVVREPTTAPSVQDDTTRYVFLGRLEDGNDTETYPVDFQLGDIVTIRMSPTSGDLDTSVAIRDGNGDVIIENDNAEGFDTLNSILTYDVRVGASYVISAERGDGDTSGDYILDITVD